MSDTIKNHIHISFFQQYTSYLKKYCILLEMETQDIPATVGLSVFLVVALVTVAECLQAFLGFPD